MSHAAPSPDAVTAPDPPLERRIERQAYALGFDLVGIASLGPVATAAHFDDWIARGCEGEMGYMARDPHLRRDTRLPHPGAASAVVVAMDYGGREPSGPVARYARGDDYHELMKERLRNLHTWLAAEVGHEVDARPYVDTAPILERDLARRAGLGWFGKNTNLINPQRGSFFFIGSLFVALDLQPSAPFEADRCGSCTRCLDACPTDAFDGPRRLDARRCISYLTIEHRDAIPEGLRPLMGELLYGCDICQEVCPWNQAVAVSSDRAWQPRPAFDRPRLRTLAALSDDELRRDLRGSAMKRTGVKGLRRNLEVCVDNLHPGDPGSGDAREVRPRRIVEG